MNQLIRTIARRPVEEESEPPEEPPKKKKTSTGQTRTEKPSKPDMNELLRVAAGLDRWPK